MKYYYVKKVSWIVFEKPMLVEITKIQKPALGEYKVKYLDKTRYFNVDCSYIDSLDCIVYQTLLERILIKLEGEKYEHYS